MSTGNPAVRVRLLGIECTPITSSSGIEIEPADSIREVGVNSDIVILAGALLSESQARKLANSISFHIAARRRRGMRVFAVAGACRVLALQEHSCGLKLSAPPHCIEAWRESCDRVTFIKKPNLTDGGIASCAGGEATLALGFNIIGETLGEKVRRALEARSNCEQYVDESASKEERHVTPKGEVRPTLQRAIEVMERNLEELMTTRKVAELIGVPLRQLQRLFRQHYGMTPGVYYMLLRMKRSRQLVQLTDLSMTEIAMAVGFQAMSHFSRKYRVMFGSSPRQERGQAVSTRQDA